MKKKYEKPTLNKLSKLPEVTAVVCVGPHVLTNGVCTYVSASALLGGCGSLLRSCSLRDDIAFCELQG